MSDTCERCGASVGRNVHLCRDCAAATGKSSPVGIKVICVAGAIDAVFAFVLGFTLFLSGGLGMLYGLLVLGLTTGQVAILYGLWTVRGWAWGWALILYGLWIVRGWAWGWAWEWALILHGLNVLLQGWQAYAEGRQEAFLALFVSAGIIAYIYSKREVYLD